MSYQTIHGIPVWGEPIYNALEQMEQLVKPDARAVALMADHHHGYGMPIGGVAAYRHHIPPAGVGFDIACGNKAVKLDIKAEQIRPDLARIMDDLSGTISFGLGQKNNEEVWDSCLDINGRFEMAWEIVRDISQQIGKGRTGLRDIAWQQLGTVGGGNHYVDLFADEDDYVWVGVHFGSRGLGHKIASHFVKAVGGNEKPDLLNVDDDLGRQYLHCMALAGHYAYAGRTWVCNRVAHLLGANVSRDVLDTVHNHHNYAWCESHEIDGQTETLWVVRKGATPAWPGERGFIGGSMAEPAVIVEGLENPESQAALYSTVHGAGRVMSRSQAKGKYKNGQWKREPAVDRQDMRDWVHQAGVELRGGDLDEAPQVYKRLEDVLKYHAPTVAVQHLLQPMGVAMAGPETNDPYKD
jgi:tRNA-splicing ligase RtcB